MEYLIEKLTEAVAENDLGKAEIARDEIAASRDEIAPALHLLAETICYRLEDPNQ